MEIKTIEIDSIQTHPKNTHHASLGPIIESLEKNGYYSPIVVSETTGNIIKGNHTYKALKKLGNKTIKAIFIPDLSEEEEIRILIADNKIASLGYENDDALNKLLLELPSLEGTGFFEEKKNILETLESEKAEETSACGAGVYDALEKDDLETKLSNLGIYPKNWFQINGSYVYYGSFEDPEYSDFLQQKNIKGQLLLTDPPYNVSFEGTNPLSQHKKIENDSFKNREEYTAFCKTFMETSAKVLEAGASAYIFFDYKYENSIREALEENGFRVNSKLIWVKRNTTSAVQIYGKMFEEIFFAIKKGAPLKFYGLSNETTILNTKQNFEKYSKEKLVSFIENNLGLFSAPTTPSKQRIHPTEKPVGLLEKFIKNSSKKGDYVFDLFAGSFSTLRACLKNGRNNVSSEIDGRFIYLFFQKYLKENSDSTILIEKTGEEISYDDFN